MITQIIEPYTGLDFWLLFLEILVSPLIVLMSIEPVSIVTKEKKLVHGTLT